MSSIPTQWNSEEHDCGCSGLRLPLLSEKALRAVFRPLCCPSLCLRTPSALLVVAAEWRLHIKSSSLFLAGNFVSKTMSRSWEQRSLLPLCLPKPCSCSAILLWMLLASPKNHSNPQCSTSIPSWWNCWPGAVAPVRWAWHLAVAPNMEFWKQWNKSALFFICAASSKTPASLPSVYAL